MEKEEWEKLGFVDESTFENEQSEKQELFKKIQMIKKRSLENMQKRREEYIRQKGQEGPENSKESNN